MRGVLYANLKNKNEYSYDITNTTDFYHGTVFSSEMKL